MIDMAKLTTAKRKKLKTSTFGMPGERKYPMPDRSHAVNAKARAQQQFNKGNLSKSSLSTIDAKANKVLGKTKKKNNNPTNKSKSRNKGLDVADRAISYMNSAY